jgi:hypothetical protein
MQDTGTDTEAIPEQWRLTDRAFVLLLKVILFVILCVPA